MLFSFFALENIPFAGLYSFFSEIFGFLKEGLLVFKGNTHKSKSVLDEIFLYHVVEGSAGLKRGGMIDLYNNRFEIIHNHNIKAKNMEAHISLILLGLAIRILVSN
jgi:hypothetical protein